MQPSKVSWFDLVDMPITGQEQAIDANLVAVQTDLRENLPDGLVPDENLTQVLLETRPAGQIEALKPKQLYRLDFRTSQYPTLSVAAWNQNFSLCNCRL